METLIGIKQVHHFQAVVFKIPTSRGDMFMYAERSNYMNAERAVVEVDSEKFLRLWRGPFSSHPEVACGNPETWPKDSKFHWSADHFAEGIKNPVPLAQVSVRMVTTQTPIWRRKLFFLRSLAGSETTESPSLNFTDGITRTIWLLTFGAKSFPVECSTAEAPLMKKLVGTGSRYQTVDELFSAEYGQLA